MSMSLGYVGGPGLGGLLIGWFTAPMAILVDAASFLVSAGLLARIAKAPPSPSEPRGRRDFLREIWEGLQFITGHPVLRAFATSLATINLFGELFLTVYLIYLVRTLHLSPPVIGAVLAVSGLGGVGGALAAGWLGRRLGVGRVIAICAAPFSLALIPLAPLTAPIPWLVAGGFLSNFTGVAYNINQRSLRQALTPARLQGRMTATMRFLIIAPVPLGTTFGGALGSLVGLRPALWIGAIGSLLAAVPILLSPALKIRAAPEEGPEGDHVQLART
jgi:predicted MFS family arabinose efflux permease